MESLTDELGTGVTLGRPALRGSRYVVSSGHPLASVAGLRMFERGGNAVDAGVAAGLVLNVVLPEWTGIGGVAPILVLDARTRRVSSVRGLGRWPRAADPELFRVAHRGRIPPGVLRCVTPAALGAWLTALQRFGRLRLDEVLAPALELAERGFPVHEELRLCLEAGRQRFARWSGTWRTFYPGGETPRAGVLLRQPELARTLRRLMQAASRHERRELGLGAALDLFYRGEIAREVAAFFEREGGWLHYDDLAGFEAVVEEPVATTYRGVEVFACGPWCQGPTVLQTLNVLEREPLAALGHNSPAYIHLVAEALKLAFADRGAYYGDPAFVRVPLRGLLSKAYAAVQGRRIDPRRCAAEAVPPGDPWRFEPGQADKPGAGPGAVTLEPGTSYVCAADADGYAFSATPSDGMRTTPLVPGLGFAISSRGVQSWLEEGHPSAMAPGKHPFLTPNPGLALRDGQLFLAYGTPGTDTQPQAMVQLLANVIDFGMDPQQAVEAPRFATYSFPRANDPHPVEPRSLYLEARISDAVAEALAAMGHQVRRWPAFSPAAGALCAVLFDRASGTLVGAADPRRLCYAVGW